MAANRRYWRDSSLFHPFVRVRFGRHETGHASSIIDVHGDEGFSGSAVCSQLSAHESAACVCDREFFEG